MSYVAVSGLTKTFPLRRGSRRVVRAVTDVGFAIPEGQTYGLVGESGSGKSTVANMMVGLIEPDRGEISVGGLSIGHGRSSRRQYLEQLSIVFQSPFSSLDPKMTVTEIVGEPLRALGRHHAAEMEFRVGVLLRIVGLGEEHMSRYPHEFSGGQRQRIAIARALAVNPRFLVLDEPTSALDVSVQARIVNLLARLQTDEGLTYLFISHNIGVVRHISRLLGVMYRGRMMETGDSETIIARPAHPYTQYLIAAVPRMARAAAGIPALDRAIHEPAEDGCPFAPRCPRRLPQCKFTFPGATALSERQTVYCHLYG
jgi:oligopeptide/dipeptide ABC transporter ATP-binding protein